MSALRSYGLADFADEYLGSEPGANLIGAGPAAAEIANVTQAETHASPLIATVLWRAFLEAGGLNELRDAYPDQLPEDAGEIKEVFVLRHPLRGGEPRHDLLVLATGDIDPRGVQVDLRPDLLESGWERLRDELEDEASAGAPLGAFARSPAALVEAARWQQFGMLIARAPEMVRTSFPSPAVDVRCPSEPEDFSSVGVLVKRVDDDAVGVTIVRHC